MNIDDIEDWSSKINFFRSDQYKHLKKFILSEIKQGKSILPGQSDIFNAFKYTKFSDLKIVIIGQDPYPNRRHAHGLSFSIPKETNDIPKSLKNILKELKDDLNIIKEDGSLIQWAKQGVLLLNTVLSVEEGLSNSHKSKGWEIFTREVISLINDQCKNIVFILWGGKAQKMKKLINKEVHLIIESPHPSPLSSYRGFFGSKPFSKSNNYLLLNKKKPINWNL